MLFPEVYRQNQLIKQLHFRRFSSPEKESEKNHTSIFVSFMIYDCINLPKPFILWDTPKKQALALLRISLQMWH